ncbi:hypothetical protein P875_00034403 [Aspergillus parasiticus SU-1]|uniref:Uncharacterized protein n=1 Tax=Aspergillus parasiticus (strain ATCC 56775 / NRRL 5862 / SRRC 143 / SU-1) TaxID=1403190 RepID=A0A0F0I4U0_ASPPU|nr:hypothetical protein P875_00034403 [Aspergillus parasiticus SU-1]
MKLFISSILSISCLAKVANASLGALNNPGLFPFVFNGVAVFNYPNWTTKQPRDGIKEGENFFCYATEKGYLSFGWWLDAAPGTSYSHCRPDSPDFVWYEYSEKIQCTETGCKAHVVNYWAANNSLKFETDYVFSDANLALPELGTLSTFYRDEEQGASAVGTRHVLSSTSSTALDCCKALKTFREIKDKYNLNLSFDLKDICPPQETVKRSWWRWGQLPMDGGCDSELSDLRTQL